MDVWNRVGNFSTLQLKAESGDAHARGFVALQTLGWAIAASCVINVLMSVILTPISMSRASEAGVEMSPFILVSSLVGAMFTIAFTLAALWWIGYTLEEWLDKRPAGHSNALVIAILATVLFGLGTLVVMIAGIFVLVAFGFATTGAEVEYFGLVPGIVKGLMVAAQAGIAVWLLTVVADRDVKAHFEA